MSQFLKTNKTRILLILFILTLIPLLSKIGSSSEEIKVQNEKYDANLKNLNSLNKLLSYADETYNNKNLNSTFDTSQYVEHLGNIFKYRFYHDDLVYTFSENWIAWICGKTLWSHVSFIVLTDDILKHSMSICSQQTTVFMEALKKKGITVRSVGLGFDEGPGHYLCEVWYGGAWHLHDVSNEPNWEKIQNAHMNLDYYLSQKDTLYKAYEGRIPKPIFYKILERHIYGKTNDLPAKHMKLFHRFTNILTYLLPIIFGLLFIISSRSKNREQKTLSSSVQNESVDNFMKEKINS